MPVLKIKKDGVWTEVVPDAVAENTAAIEALEGAISNIEADYLTSDDKYTLPVAGDSIGGVKSGGDITVASDGTVSVKDDSHNHYTIRSTKLSTSILEEALTFAASTVANYRFSGYAGTDLPHDNYKYGQATVYWRDTNSIVVVLMPTTSLPMQYNFYNGSSWSGWRAVVDSSTTPSLATSVSNRCLALIWNTNIATSDVSDS